MEGGRMSRCIAFIQARMSSSRFPGKVLEPLAGIPSIVFMVHRARRAKLLDDVIVVTSSDASDNALEAGLHAHGLPCFRGDLQDVLRRYAQAATAHGATEVVRLTGDCPLIDGKVIDDVIRARRHAHAHYAANTDPPTFPDGLDCEAFEAEVLHRADRHADRPSEREHVTLWMRRDDVPLRRVNVKALADTSHLRLTIDYPDDLAVVRRIVDQLGGPHDDFDWFDVLRVLDAQPALLNDNAHTRNEGLTTSLAQEATRST
jgi:spore coat polysaccharide biosynthesis protein SpsF (cytidylyltransferase family)